MDRLALAVALLVFGALFFFLGSGVLDTVGVVLFVLGLVVLVLALFGRGRTNSVL